MLKKIFAILGSLTFFLGFSAPVSAHCPLCTVGIIGGLTLTRWLGIDDIYSGIWAGALIGSVSFWFGNSLKKKFLPLQEYLIFLVLFLLTTLPFIYMFPSPKLFGGSRLFTGMLIGGTVFILSGFIDKILRRFHANSALFPYQGVIMTIGSVVVAVLFIFLLKV